MNSITLSNGVKIPQVGLGVFRTPDGQATVDSVRWALEAGYRHIDTAMIYRNEAATGQGMRESGVAREDIFLTTKLWNEDIRQHRARAAFEESLERLGTDYVDLYLIHWPADGFAEAWSVMEDLYDEGRIKAIGVSNFQVHHLDELAKTARYQPMVNQIESNPGFSNQALVDECAARGICVEAWSPLGGTGGTTLSTPELIQIGQKHGKSAAQVIIRWMIQRGVVVLPKSTHKDRIAQNLDVFDFELDADDLSAIAALETGVRTGADPDNFNF